jgi:hypothetical protein
MVTWILIETAIIRGFGILQAAYYLTGIAELAPEAPERGARAA